MTAPERLRQRKGITMNFRKLTAALAAAAIILSCGCSVRPSSDAAWVTGSVSNKKDLTISIDDFNKQYKFWLFQQQIPDDTASEVTEKCAAQRSTIINGLIDEKIILDQAEKLGVTLSEEDQTAVEESYNQLIDGYIESCKNYVNAGESGTGEVVGEDAILKEAEAYFDEKLTECGMTRDDILMSARTDKIKEKVKAKLAEDNTIDRTDAEKEYEEIVSGIKDMYEQEPTYYESYSYYSYYWLPENSRRIKHILLKFDDADSTEISTQRANGDDEAAESAREAAAEKLMPKAEEIVAQLDSGADFDEMVKEYSDDSGSTQDGFEGYLVVPEGGIYYKEFQQGAYELENIGDYKIVTTDIGVHILQYAADAKLDDETTQKIIDVILESLQETAADTAYDEAMEQWHEEYSYDIAYNTLDIEEPQPSTEESAASDSAAESTTSGTDSDSAASGSAAESAAE